MRVSYQVQGNCILSEQTREDLEQVVLVPSGPETLGLDPHLGCFLLLQQVEGDMSQGGEVLSAMLLADSTLVFTECYVQDSMQAIFYLPMGSSRIE